MGRWEGQVSVRVGGRGRSASRWEGQVSGWVDGRGR